MGIPILALQRRAMDIIRNNFGFVAGVSALYTGLAMAASLALSGVSSVIEILLSAVTGLGASVYDLNSYYFGASMVFGCMALSLVFSLAFSVAAQGAVAPLTVGSYRIVLQLLAGGKAQVEWLFTPFRSFWRCVGAALWVMLWTTLWSLLFIVPGIIKALSYSQTLWLVARCPDLPIREAMRISIAMTDGYKGDIFVAWLLLLAWSLASVLLLCTLVGPLAYMILWLWPLQVLLMGGVHRYLINSALQRGVVRAQELGPGGIPAETPADLHRTDG